MAGRGSPQRQWHPSGRRDAEVHATGQTTAWRRAIRSLPSGDRDA
ncbi:MAG: hypothetical protein ACKOFW_15630 [Planctomycetaceae bacterium]